jgi:regulator of protease activity HflC (stomatin/prohibitin superfamily)
VALRFGKQTGGLLDPGFRFSFPAPIGEMITVDTGNRDMDLRRDFWVYVEVGDEGRPDDSLPSRLKLNPARDNSLVTADQNIAHTQWLALYRIEDPAAYAENMIPSEADEIIRAALRSAVIRAVAETTIDDLLKQTEGEQGTIATRVRVIAQDTLDKIDSGVRIQQLSLDRKIPPPYLLDDFNKVQSALANANRKETEARSRRDTVLNAAAGKVAPALVALIDEYEAAVELGNEAESERIYARIGDIMEGREVLTIEPGLTKVFKDFWMRQRPARSTG